MRKRPSGSSWLCPHRREETEWSSNPSARVQHEYPHDENFFVCMGDSSYYAVKRNENLRMMLGLLL